MYWEHLGHFNRAISHLKWHKIVCMRYLAWNPLTCFPCICNLESPDISYGDLLRVEHKTSLFITRVSEVIMFSPCMFVCLCVCLCLSRCLSGRFDYEGLVPHKQYFAGTLLGMSSCASYVSRTHDVIDDVTRSQNRSNFEIDISPSIFELEHRSKTQNVGNAQGYLSGIFNFRYNFR